VSLVDRTIERLFERLVSEPFSGTQTDLANEIGVEPFYLRAAIARVRTPEHVAEYGWTVPYGRRGSNANVWRIVDSEDLGDNDVMTDANNRRAAEMLATTRRNIGQSRLAVASLDGRSRAARQWRDILQSQEEIEYRLVKLVEDEDED